jgi:hypothetical protein
VVMLLSILRIKIAPVNYRFSIPHQSGYRCRVLNPGKSL